MIQKRLFTDDPHLTEFYRKHLQSETWKMKRREVRRRSEGRCEQRWGGKRCPNRATEVHHITYDHLGDERLSEMMDVCRSCHEAIEQAKRDARKMKAVVTFAEKKHGKDWLDAWDYDEVENEFDEWAERNSAA